MSTLVQTAGVLLGLAGAVAFVVQWIRRARSEGVQLDETSAALEAARKRIAQAERGAEAERARRRTELDARAAAVRTRDDADRLLRDVTSGTDTN